jgi:hypothetical protein
MRDYGSRSSIARVEEVPKSALENVPKGIRRRCYRTPAGDEFWKLLLVVAVFQMRGNAPNPHAAERKIRRAIGRVRDSSRLESRNRIQEFSAVYLELVVEEILEQLPPQNQVMVALRLDGCEVVDVARLTRRSARSVERLLNESRLKLVSLLKKGECHAASGCLLAGNGAG